MTPEKAIDAVLVPHIASATRRAAAVAALVRALTDEGHLYEGIETVEVAGSAAPVEQVYAYGLTIALDAGGNAVSVTSPYGLAVAA